RSLWRSRESIRRPDAIAASNRRYAGKIPRGAARRAEEPVRPAHPSPPGAHRVLRLGRSRVGRTLVVVLRPASGVPRAGNSPPPRPVPGGRDGGDGVPDLGLLQPDHRAVPHRRRRLPGRHHAATSQLGLIGVGIIFLRAFSLGGGTFTGIEAVSNGVGILSEPRVHTGKRTMLYMASSLAFTAGGILVCYLLNNVQYQDGKTL